MQLDKGIMHDDSVTNVFQETAKKGKNKGDYFDDLHVRFPFHMPKPFYVLIEAIREAKGNKKGYKTKAFNQAVATYLDTVTEAQWANYQGVFNLQETFRITTFYIEKALLEQLDVKLAVLYKQKGKEKGLKAEVMMDIIKIFIETEAHSLGKDFIDQHRVKEVLDMIDLLPRGR